MGFNVMCSPGRDAAATVMRMTPQMPMLVIYLDPVNVSIHPPPFPDGPLVMAKLCRELAREAARIAAELDPEGESRASRGRSRDGAE